MVSKHLGTSLRGGCPFIQSGVVLWFFISFTGSLSHATLAIEFPGPVAVDVLGTGLSMMVVAAQELGQQNVLVATEDGFLAIVGYDKHQNRFHLEGRTYLGGQLVGMVPWEGYQGVGQGVILASREPDLLYFMGVTPTEPYFDFVQTVNLPEDPGGMAFAGGGAGQELELGITLPGVDQLAILNQQDGVWALKQTLAGGDSPTDLVGLDMDGDLIREFICADNGVLSGALSIFYKESDGDWHLQNHHSLEGRPLRVEAWDLDQDGTEELVVGYSDVAKVVFLDALGGNLLLLGSVPLVSAPAEFHLERGEFGLTNLFVANEERGLVEYFQGQDFPFTRINSYYPGCLPGQLTLCDFNGDGKKDLAALGATNSVVTVLFSQQEEGFWGHTAQPFTAEPSAGVLGDFNADGFTDLVVGGLTERVLDFFAGTVGGSLEQYAQVQDLSHIAHNLVSIQADADPAMELASFDPLSGLVRVMDFIPGSGFVKTRQMALGVGCTGLLAADCDGDGLDDLVGILSAQSTVSIFYGQPGGGFTEAEPVLFDGLVRDVKVLHLNVDGLPDLVVSDGSYKVRTALNLGNRAYQNHSWTSTASGTSWLALADLDGDSDLDIVTGNTFSESLGFIENRGDGSLATVVSNFLLPAKPIGIKCVDLNIDGFMDVVVTLEEDGGIGVVVGRGQWQFGYTRTIGAGARSTEVMVGDFNNDFVPDLYVIDGALKLGLTLLNVERILVPVHPSTLVAQCRNAGLGIDVNLSPAESWSLAVGRPGRWQVVVQNGIPAMGLCVFDHGRWRIYLSDDQVQNLEESTGSWGVLSLHLVVGSGPEAEELIVNLEGNCQAEGQDFRPLQPSWVRVPYPNPFNPSLQADFNLARGGLVEATVYDARGYRVATLLDETRDAGTHSLFWDGSSTVGEAGAGVYFLKVTTEFGIISQKVLLLK